MRSVTAVLALAVMAASVGNVWAEHGDLSPQELLPRITVSPEVRDCPNTYKRNKQYPYRSKKLRKRLLRRDGRVTAYERVKVPADAIGKDVEVEHVVALSEAHESGACGWSRDRQRMFARDVLNLTLALPEVNGRKGTQDLGDGWMPHYNRCWYAATVVRVKAHYGLAMDPREHAEASRVIESCLCFERDTRAAKENHLAHQCARRIEEDQ